MKSFLLGFLFTVSLGATSFAEKVNDLGTSGFVCELDLDKFKQTASDKLNSGVTLVSDIPSEIKTPPVPHSKSCVEKTTHTVKMSGKFLIEGTTLFIFGANDPKSIDLAKTVKAQYGVCIDYVTPEDIVRFREKTGVTYPIQTAPQELIDEWGLTCFPAVAEIKGEEIEIKNL